MILYSFDPRTGVFLGQFDARVDLIATQKAKEADEDAQPIYLVPSNCTPISPPPMGPKQTAIFRKKRWELIADHRYELWFDPVKNQEVIIGTVGDPTQHGFTQEIPLQMVKNHHTQLLMNSPPPHIFSSSALGDPYSYWPDMANLQMLIALGGSAEIKCAHGQPMKDSDWALVGHSEEQVKTVARDLLISVKDLDQRRKTIINQIDGATTRDEIEMVKW